MITSKDVKMISLAKKLAKKSTFNTYKMCCVIVNGSKIVSVGLNSSSPGILKNPTYKNKGIHCELDSVIGVPENELKGSTAYVAGITRGGNDCLSMSCETCYELLKRMKVKKIVYHTKEGEVKSVRIA